MIQKQNIYSSKNMSITELLKIGFTSCKINPTTNEKSPQFVVIFLFF